VRLEHLAEVHAVQLVAGQDEHVVAGVLLDVADLLATASAVPWYQSVDSLVCWAASTRRRSG